MRPSLLGLVLVAAVLFPVAPASAAEPCSVGVGLDSASADCQWTFIAYTTSSSSGDGHTWVVALQCGNGGICRDLVECVEGGEAGLWHDVYMDGADVGDVCVPDSETPETTIAEIVLDDFKSYSWPESQLVIQPPGSRTLVNLETIFFTDNDSPRTHDIVVGGRNVTVEATPVSYIWSHGDGTVEQTRSPGRPHPDHDVFHVYDSVGEVEVGVDTVYGNGRFRVGAGEWRTIPGAPTVTVVGPVEDLEIVEAIPQLVLR